MIKDTPLTVLIATALCALAALAVLEGEGWLSRRHPRAFTSAIVAVSAIYLGFVGYAIEHAVRRAATNEALTKLYISTAPLLEAGQSLGKHMPQSNDPEFLKSIDQFELDWLNWNEKARSWLASNLGDAAREQLLDVSTIPVYCLGPPNQGCNTTFSSTLNQVINAKNNLAIIMQSRGVTY